MRVRVRVCDFTWSIEKCDENKVSLPNPDMPWHVRQENSSHPKCAEHEVCLDGETKGAIESPNNVRILTPFTQADLVESRHNVWRI